jgi:hypothetical protein
MRAGGGDIAVVNSTRCIEVAADIGRFAATQHALRAVAG